MGLLRFIVIYVYPADLLLLHVGGNETHTSLNIAFLKTTIIILNGRQLFHHVNTMTKHMFGKAWNNLKNMCPTTTAPCDVPV